MLFFCTQPDDRAAIRTLEERDAIRSQTLRRPAKHTQDLQLLYMRLKSLAPRNPRHPPKVEPQFGKEMLGGRDLSVDEVSEVSLRASARAHIRCMSHVRANEPRTICSTVVSSPKTWPSLLCFLKPVTSYMVSKLLSWRKLAATESTD